MATPGEQDKIERMLQKRPPLPPDPVDARWTWNRPKLKAVYLDAFTQLSKAEIAEALDLDPKTLYKWRRAPDYRRYLAALIAADGLADRAERVKARKSLALSLGDAITARMATPGALAGEKLSSLLRAQREMLDALQEDAESLRELGAEQDAQARAGAARPGLDLVEKLALISDPTEREIVKRHLLRLMGEYLDAPRIIDAAPIDAQAEAEAQAGAVDAQAEPERAASAPESCPQDLDAFTEAEPTAPDAPAPPAQASAPDAAGVTLDDFAE